MARISLLFVIFLMFLNLGAGAMASAGVWDAWGVNPNPGADALVEDANESGHNVSATNPSGSQTLFGLFTSAAGSLLDAFVLATIGAPLMFANLGVPTWINGLLFGPIYVIVAADVVAMLTGRDTI